MIKKMEVKQQIVIAPQVMKVKEGLMKEVARMLIQMDLMHPRVQVTGFMIFLIKTKKSFQKVQLSG